MKWTLGLLTPLLLTAGVAVTVPTAAEAAPLPAAYSATAVGRVADVDLDVIKVLKLASVGLAPSRADVDSALSTNPVTSRSSNLQAAVAGLGVGVASNTVTAPPDTPSQTGSLAGFNLLGIGLGALTTTNEAHYGSASGCVPTGLLSQAKTETLGVTVAPAGLVQVLRTGVSSTTGKTQILSTGGNGLNKKVVSTTSGNITGVTVLNAVSVAVTGDSTLTATATGKSGGAAVGYSPGIIKVTAGGTTTTLTAGASKTVDVGLGGATGQVIVTANQPTVTEAVDGLSASGDVSVVSLTVRVGPEALPTANATINLLPLSATAKSPTGGIDCKPSAPVLTTPADGSTTADTTPTFEGTGLPGASINLTVGGTTYPNVATVNGSGAWSYTPTTPLALGTYTATATQTYNGATSAQASNANTFTIRAATAVTLTSSAESVRLGSSVTLTAGLDPNSARGTVTFTDTPSNGEPTTLGTANVGTNGVATLDTVLPTFGRHTVVASYGGNSTHSPATSVTLNIEVTAYVGEVLITEVRGSGPGGAADSYIELYNTGPDAPLAGFTVQSSSGVSVDLPSNAPVLGSKRSYLISGNAFSLGARSTPDRTVTSLGTGGWQLLASDTGRTRTDAVGPAAGYHRGNGLAAISGTPTAQAGWIRVEKAGRPVDTGDNATDFALVSTNGAVVGGVQSALGSPSPTGLTDPFQHNAQLQSYLLNPDGAVEAVPNRVSVVGTPGTLTVRRTITNTSLETITAARARITALSEANGLPRPDGPTPAKVALIRAVNPATATSSVPVSSRGTVTVRNLSVDAPNAVQPGGGLNSTLGIPLPAGGLVPGASVDVAFTFDVDTRGTFWFGYDVDAVGTLPSELRTSASKTGASSTVTKKATKKAAELTKARDQRIAKLGVPAKNRVASSSTSGTL